MALYVWNCLLHPSLLSDRVVLEKAIPYLVCILNAILKSQQPWRTALPSKIISATVSA
jgi:hypothetical protein